jgi:hypothetical protein
MGLPPPPRESEVEKTARFTRHLLMGIVIVVIIVAVVVAVVFVYNAVSQINQVQIRVQYSGSWTGAYFNGVNGETSFSGNGDKTIILDRASANGVWIIEADAMPTDGGSGTLTISILKMDGTVLQTSSSNTAYGGLATVTVSLSS